MEKQILEILQSMQGDMASMKKDMHIMKEDIQGIKSTLAEHGQILRAIDERTQVHSAEIANLQHEMAEVKGDIKAVKKDMSRVEEATAHNWVDIAKLKAAR